MLETIFNPIYSETFTIGSYLVCTLVSIILGIIIAFVSGVKSPQTKSMRISLIILPAIVQTVIMLVNGNIGTGLAVMGAFSLVRFRSLPGSAKEILSIFLAMAAGLVTAMGYVALASVFVIIISLCMFAANYINLTQKDDLNRELRITVPEDLNYAHAFDDLFDKYAKNVKLVTVKTTNMGSLYKLIYKVELLDEDNVQAFIDDLRCRNGNLEIALTIPTTIQSEL
ncbi:MAG: DUF4956 domain-containing protein [Ruminococcus sp.]|nr:DUF4956 domain-containing protein [Ruminococcus sp.]